MIMRIAILLLVLFISLPALAETKYEARWMVTCTNDERKIIFQKASYHEPAFGYNTSYRYIRGHSSIDGLVWYYYPLTEINAICIMQSIKDFENENN